MHKYTYDAIRKQCNKKYMKSVYKTSDCFPEMFTRNAYFLLGKMPGSCHANKLYRQPNHVCTPRPFPRVVSFTSGCLEVLRFGRQSDIKHTINAPPYTFYYAAPKTTGLFLHLPRPLVALNKLDALIKLGWDFEKRIRSVTLTTHPGDQYIISTILSRTQSKKAFIVELRRILGMVKSGIHYSIIFGVHFFDFYDLDLIRVARHQEYDSVVLLNEPYDRLESATEIIHLLAPSQSLSMLTNKPTTNTAVKFAA